MTNKTTLAAAAIAAFGLSGCASTGGGMMASPGDGSERKPVTMFGAATGAAEAPAAAAGKKGECWGVNACKGQGACGGVGHECAGNNACKGKGWLSLTRDECEGRKGTFKPG